MMCVVWLCVTNRHGGNRCELASTFCMHDLRKGDLFVQSWVRVRRVGRESLSSDQLWCGAEYKSNMDLKITNTSLPMATHSKVLGSYLRPKTHIQHTPSQHISTHTQAAMRPALEYTTSIWFLLLSTHSHDPFWWGSPIIPLASSAVTPAGSALKSRGDNMVRMWSGL